MPKAYDLNPLVVDRNPLHRIDNGGNLPKLDMPTFWDNLLESMKNLTGLDFSSVGALAGSLAGLVKASVDSVLEVIASVFGFVGDLAELATWTVTKLFGMIDPRRLSKVPIGTLTDDPVNMMQVGSFQSTTSIAPNPAWERDPDVGRLKNGAARVTADGTMKVLRSVMIPVGAGQMVDFSTYVRWSDLAWSGLPFALGVRYFRDGDTIDSYELMGSETIDTHTPTNPTWNGWVQLRGTWTPPEGVTACHMRLIVNPAAQAGTIWWDDADCRQVSRLRQSWIEGLALFTSGLNQIGDAFAGAIVTPISEAVQSVVDWLRDMQEYKRSVESTQINLQQFQIAALAESGNRNAPWVCRYPVGDVSYPEFMNARTDIFGETDPASAAGEMHTHTMSGSLDTYATPAGWSVPAGQARGSYIGISATTIMDTAGVIVWRQGTHPSDQYWLEVLREEEDESLTMIRSEDITSRVGGTQLVEIALPNGMIAEAGERYVVRVRNSAASVNNPYAKAIRYGAGMDNASHRVSGELSLKTTLTTAEAQAAKGNIQQVTFALLAAKDLAVTARSWGDDFNDRDQLGGLWSMISDTAQTQLYITGDRVAFRGTTDGSQNALYVRATSSDRQRVEASVYNPSAPGAGPMLNCSRDFTQCVWLMVTGTTARILTGPWNGMVERAQVAVGGTDRWALEYDPATGIYTALKADEPIGLSWHDSAGEMKHGRNYRYGGLRIRRSFFANGGQMDNWTLKDWVPA